MSDRQISEAIYGERPHIAAKPLIPIKHFELYPASCLLPLYTHCEQEASMQCGEISRDRLAEMFEYLDSLDANGAQSRRELIFYFGLNSAEAGHIREAWINTQGLGSVDERVAYASELVFPEGA
jgi:hypothetical protein